MIIFRPQRGTLKEAMLEAKEYPSIDEMKNAIVEEWDGLIQFEDIVLDDEVIEDERVFWRDCWLVCVRKLGDQDYIKIYGFPQCIGYCATDYDR